MKPLRNRVGQLAAVVAACCILSFASFCLRAQNLIPRENDNTVIAPVAHIKAFVFHPQEVRLLDSPFKRAMEADAGYLLMLEPDRLLSQFRTHAGLEPKAERYGGWESLGLAGHTLGHYLSACALHYAATGDKGFLGRVNYIVSELKACQTARKTGYVGAIPREDSVFLEVSQGNIRSRGFDLNGAWSPWYTIHKVMAGLLDAYVYCDNKDALDVTRGMADWADRVLKNLTGEQIQQMLICEYGGMNEVFVNLYALTGDKEYLDLSYKFHDNRILDSLGMGVDVLPGKHSNTQVPKAIGAVRRHELTGNPKDLAIGKFFWNTVVSHHTYAPGGNSNYEYLGEQDKLNDKLTDNTMETCNTYNMLKLTRHLFALNPSAHYVDFYERALYNHILASQDRRDGMMCYFVPLRMGTKKEFSDPYHSFTCCVGSGMENHVKYGENIYSKGHNGSLYVNLFIPSQLDWKEKRLRVLLQTDLPAKESATLTLHTETPIRLPMKIRKPYWVPDRAMEVHINGVPVDATPDTSGYVVLEREWQDDDEIRVTLPLSLHAMTMPDNPSRQAFFWGPVLLAGNLGLKEPDPSKGVPVFVTREKDLSRWIHQQSTDPLTFSTASAGVPSDVQLQPFYEISDEYYSVYWDVFTPAQWQAQEKLYEEKRRREHALEQRTVDMLRVGEMQPERDHNLTGERTEAGESHTRKFRLARDGGSFSFDLKVLPEGAHTLVATYWGMDNRGRKFSIIVEGDTIGTEDLNRYKESRFYDISYPIPEALTKGRQQVAVKFQALPGNTAGPVYGVRLVRGMVEEK